MEAHSHLGGMDRRFGHGDGSGCHLGWGHGRRGWKVHQAVWTALTAIRRDWVCHALAATFCALIVVPVMAVITDRGAPYRFAHYYFTPSVGRPGDLLTLVFMVDNITRNCDGEVRQTMIDAEGKVFDLGKVPTFYALDRGPVRVLARAKSIPFGMAPGPAVYRAFPNYWCNPFQRAWWPIETQAPDVRFTVVP